jgi:hypothetical protein
MASLGWVHLQLSQPDVALKLSMDAVKLLQEILGPTMSKHHRNLASVQYQIALIR